MEKVPPSSNYLNGLIFAVILITGSFFIFLSPFMICSYEESGNIFVLKINGNGHWSLWKDGDFLRDGGITHIESILGLQKFPMYSASMIVIALILSYISLFVLTYFISKEHEHFNKHRRISGIVSITISLMGFIGTMLQIPYTNYLKSVYEVARLNTGFYLSAIMFGLIILFCLVPIIKPDHYTKLRTKTKETPTTVEISS